MKIKEQLALVYPLGKTRAGQTYKEKLTTLLQSDLDFHNQSSSYATHNFHSFPAKFPPQLPKVFIEELTNPYDVVLDPMMGSGTTIVEAFLANRKAIGFDIDPLSLLISQIKITPANPKKIMEQAKEIDSQARYEITHNTLRLENLLNSRFDARTKQFLDIWFLPETQIELMALAEQIDLVKDSAIQTFLQVCFSSTIITKSGGVSLALDLAHTRPHKAKIIIDKNKNCHSGQALIDTGSNRNRLLTKTVKSPLEEFWKKVTQNLKSVITFSPDRIQPDLQKGDSQQLHLPDDSIDLIVTSPPYASNAIDYMRAHKFSLVWLGYPVDELTLKRKDYIGGELVMDFNFEELPLLSRQKIVEISGVDVKRGKVLHRYYSEMTRALKEMYRVLRPDKAAIVVVGSSVMKGIDTETHKCLAEIGENLGFIVPHIGIRKIDRNKRMLPAGFKTNLTSQIEQRMHEEYIIGFYKPA